MTHTPGPWRIHDRSTTISASFEIIPEKGMTVASVPAYVDDELGRANAALISAAPEMLEALRELQQKLHRAIKMDVKRHYSLMVADVAASKAIAKAEGRP